MELKSHFTRFLVGAHVPHPNIKILIFSFFRPMIWYSQKYKILSCVLNVNSHKMAQNYHFCLIFSFMWTMVSKFKGP